MSGETLKPNMVIRDLSDGTRIEISLVNAFGSPKLHAFLLSDDSTRLAITHRNTVAHMQDPLLDQYFAFNEGRYSWESDACRDLCCTLGISLSYVRPFYDESAFAAASSFEFWYHDNSSDKRALDSEQLQFMFQCLTALDEKLPQQQRTSAFETAKEMLGLKECSHPSLLTQYRPFLKGVLESGEASMQDDQSQIVRELYWAAEERFLGASEVVIHFLPCANFHKGRATIGVFRPYGAMTPDFDVTGFWRMPGVAVQPITMNRATKYVIRELEDRYKVRFLSECEAQNYLENQGLQFLQQHKWMRSQQSPVYRIEIEPKARRTPLSSIARLLPKSLSHLGGRS
jgi:hypothetical protein